MSTGTDLRDQGVENVLAADCAPHRGYADLCHEAINNLIDAGIPFTAEEIRDWVAERHPEAYPHSPNVLPAAIRVASQKGRIVAIGIRQATRRSRHANRNLVWRAA